MQTQFDKVVPNMHPGAQSGSGADCLCPPVCFQCPPPFCLPCGPGPGGVLPEEAGEHLPGPRQCGPFIMLNTPVERKTILLPMDVVKRHERDMPHQHDDHHHDHEEHRAKGFKPGRYKHNHKPGDDDRHDGFDDSVLTGVDRRRRGYHKHYNGEVDDDCCEKPHHHHHGGEENLECCEKPHHHHHHHDNQCKKLSGGKKNKHKSEDSSDEDESDDSTKENTPGRKKNKVKRKGIRNTSRELRAGKLYVGCDCEKRNGLQDDCLRSLCMGSAKCTTNPPTCLPSEFSNGKHLAKRKEEAERKLTEKYKKLC